MDKHDLMILDIVQQHKREQQEHIRLATLERNFWKRIEGDVTLSVGQARIGERITIDHWSEDEAWRARCDPQARWLSTKPRSPVQALA